MTIRLNFERNVEKECVDVFLTPEITEDTSRVERAWGKLGLGYAQKVAEKHTFELNKMRQDQPCHIDIEGGAGNSVSLTYSAPDSKGVIGGLTSSTFALSSIVLSMLQEALEANGHMDDEDEEDWEDGDLSPDDDFHEFHD